MRYYDHAAKFVSLGWPKPFSEHILHYPDLIVLEEVATEQITLQAHYTDSTLKVQFPDEVAILHNEIQTYDSREPMQLRLAGYNGFLIRKHQLNVYCSVVYLHPNAGLKDPGVYAYQKYGCEYIHRYRVVRLIEIEGESILELQEPGLLPFTPLMKPPTGMSAVQWLDKCIDETAISRADSTDKPLLFVSLAIFGGLIHDPKTLEERLPEGIMQESSIVQEYMRRAEERGHARGHASGQITNAVDFILMSLSAHFQPDAVVALKPRLEKVADLEHLRRLFHVAQRAESLEAFAENLPEA